MSSKAPTKKELIARIEFLEGNVENLLEDKARLIHELKMLRRRVRMASIFLDADTVFELGEPPE